MSELTITPTKLKGKIVLPPSKSLAHRAIICASLADGVSRIDNIEYSDDIKATISCMKALGTMIEEHGDYVVVDGSTTFATSKCEMDCNESGSTLRFMVPIALVRQNNVHFIGQGRLGQRPLDTYYEIFERQNIEYMYREGALDLYAMGQLKADVFEIPGDISSQFISGLMFALPLLPGDSTIKVSGVLESKGYIDLTLDMLSDFGIEIENNDYQSFTIKGNQKYRPCNKRVEADFSQAAFYLVASALGSDLIIQDLNLNSSQGDKMVLDYLLEMGCELQKLEDGIKLTANGLRAIEVDASQCPDVIPVLSVALGMAKGTSNVTNAKRLRIKECDRIDATVDLLETLGGKVTSDESSMTITGVDHYTSGACRTYDDHRLAMSIGIIATVCQGPVHLDNKECVGKSYPKFWDDYTMLGGIIDARNMEK
ncbi:MAG: 3-phosphoshikimate 1-carboxyvinyltransferase [Erysipelotrichaceae bacterium]|nr:3-phosphoshikimate 1-carboxyvinyltransferase [Erysipelotrichaceae bacterium]